MTVVGAHPRRKPVRYGKATGLSYQNPFSTIENTAETIYTSQTMFGRVRKAQEQSHIQYCGSITGMDLKLPIPSRTGKTRPSQIEVEAVYDVPSSDEGETQTATVQVRPMLKRKRRDDSVRESKDLGFYCAGTQHDVTAVGPELDTSTKPLERCISPVASTARVPAPLKGLTKSSGIVRSPCKQEKSGILKPISQKKVVDGQCGGVRQPASTRATKHERANSQSITPRPPPMLEPSVKSKSVLQRTSQDLWTHDPMIAKPFPESPAKSAVEKHLKLSDEGLLLALEGDSVTPFTSPSGLDILGLHISASLVPTDKTQEEKARDASISLAKSSARRKLKDSLKSGSGPTFRDDLDSDATDNSTEADVPESRGLSQLHACTAEMLSSVNLQTEENQPYLSCASKPSYEAFKPQAGGPKVTYARQRSYLIEEDISESTLLSIPLTEDLDTRKASRRTGVCLNRPMLQKMKSLSEDSEQGEDSQSGPIRSIHELRAAGGSVRISAETEALMEDIADGATTSLKRSALLDLATRLRTSSFRRDFLSNGLETRLIYLVGASNDTIFNLLLIAALLLLISGPCSPHAVRQFGKQNILAFFYGHLGHVEDLTCVAKARRANMSRRSQQDLASLCVKLLEPSLWRYTPPPRITGRTLALQCLEYTIRHLRERGFTRDILTQEDTGRLVEIFGSNNTALGFQHNQVDTCLTLSILESSTIIYSTTPTADRDSCWTNGSLDKVAEAVPLMVRQDANHPEQMCPLALRLCLNLTNGSQESCIAFTTAHIVEATLRLIETSFSTLSAHTSVENQDQAVDKLVLSLGFLTNLAEESSQCADLFAVASDGQMSPLERLLQILVPMLQKAFEVFSEHETKSNVAFGYLAVLLTSLCLDIRIQKLVAERLDGGSLRPLLAVVEEFLLYHHKVAEEIRLVEEQDVDVKAVFIGRLQDIVDTLRNRVQRGGGSYKR